MAIIVNCPGNYGNTCVLDINLQKTSDGNEDDNTKHRSFLLYPEIGFFLNQYYAVGGGLNFASSGSRFEFQGGYQETKGRSFGVYMFVKRYFPISEKFFFAMDGSLAYDRGKTTSSSNGFEGTDKSYSVGLQASPSLIFFPSPKWAIEGSIGGLSLSHSRGISNESKSTSFGINCGSISFGFAYFFRKPTE